MTQSSHTDSQPQQAWQIMPMILGTFVGLVVVSLFLFSSGEGKPEWGPLWRIRPAIVLPLAGAFWGVCYNLLVRQKFFPLSKPVTIILGILGLCVGMWMGVVVGFDGTEWD